MSDRKKMEADLERVREALGEASAKALALCWLIEETMPPGDAQTALAISASGLRDAINIQALQVKNAAKAHMVLTDAIGALIGREPSNETNDHVMKLLTKAARLLPYSPIGPVPPSPPR